LNIISVPNLNSVQRTSNGCHIRAGRGLGARAWLVWACLATSWLGLVAPLKTLTPTFAEEAKPQPIAPGAEQAPSDTQGKPLPRSKEPVQRQSGPAKPAPVPAGTGPASAPVPQQPVTPPPGTPAGAQAPQPMGPQAPAQPAPAPPSGVTFRLENADLLQFINLVAAQLRMNYVIDPAVKGTVTISTAGDLRREDLFPILQAVLKINGATAIQSGNFYRIVPLGQAAKIPVEVSSDSSGKPLPPDDRVVMRIIPLGFVLAGDMAKLLTPFLSDGGQVAVHESANVLILLDTSLNVKRLVDILQQFDSMTFAREHFRLVPIQNNVASGLIPELESIFAAYALSDKTTPIRFIPLDRINSLLVVTPEPAAFEEVEKWIQKLDQPAPPSGVQTFIYRVQNSEASYLQGLLTSTEHPAESGGVGAGPGGATGVMGGPGAAGTPGTPAAALQQAGTLQPAGPASGGPESGRTTAEGVHITTDPVNNSLIIQCTPQQYAEIVKTLKQLDVIPRQVMIEARVYEVDLTGALTFGLSYFLQQRSNAYKQGLVSFTGTNALQGSAGMLIGQTRELMGFLNASENRSRVKVLSAPTVLATDNSQAKINVGTTVPTLTSQGIISGVQAGASSVFTNTVQNIETGIIMTVKPRITSTGLVTMSINQEVSSPIAPLAGAAIQSPSISKRSITTSAVVGDGETIALGGLISDNVTYSYNRIPLLGDIPGLGALFGSTTYNRQKQELIVLLTPHIIKTTAEARDDTRDLRDSLSDLKQSFKIEKAMK